MDAVVIVVDVVRKVNVLVLMEVTHIILSTMAINSFSIS